MKIFKEQLDKGYISAPHDGDVNIFPIESELFKLMKLQLEVYLEYCKTREARQLNELKRMPKMLFDINEGKKWKKIINYIQR